MHECPIKGCPHQVPDHILMCRRHWGMVPRELQGDVYWAYRQFGLSGPYPKVREAAIAAVEETLGQ